MAASSPLHILVTGGAGFIGSTFCRIALARNYKVTILDALTYAGHLKNVEELIDNKNCFFVKDDITDEVAVDRVFSQGLFDGVFHFAAESHVDNSINGPAPFIKTNINGSFCLLEATRKYLLSNPNPNFRFIHVSTDEVYGSLGPVGKFNENSPYAPNSPYSASKAASDLLARAWFHTYNLPVIITNCSNNYGPRQFPEKMIPVMIASALAENPLPVYGKGENIRDWIHVEDHALGVLRAFEKGTPGEKYCFGGNSEIRNLDLVESICALMDKHRPRTGGKKYHDLISFVKDRAGHDLRYAVDDSRAQKELGYQRKYVSFESGLEDTILWYLNNSSWIDGVLEKSK